MPFLATTNLIELLVIVLMSGTVASILCFKLPQSLKTKVIVCASIVFFGVLNWLEYIEELTLPSASSGFLAIIGVLELVSLISIMLYSSRWREKLLSSPLNQIQYFANRKLYALIAILLPVEIGLLEFPIFTLVWTVNVVPAYRLTLGYFVILATILAIGLRCLVASLRKSTKRRWIPFGLGLFCLGLAMYLAISYIVHVIQ